MPVVQLDEFKTRQRATWEAGDYRACSPYIAEVGELVVARAGITPCDPVGCRSQDAIR